MLFCLCQTFRHSFEIFWRARHCHFRTFSECSPFSTVVFLMAGQWDWKKVIPKMTRQMWMISCSVFTKKKINFNFFSPPTKGFGTHYSFNCASISTKASTLLQNSPIQFDLQLRQLTFIRQKRNQTSLEKLAKLLLLLSLWNKPDTNLRDVYFPGDIESQSQCRYIDMWIIPTYL